MKPGHIEITDKVIFVYYELEKPDENEFWNVDVYKKYFLKGDYYVALKKYEASKQSIEVSNVFLWKESKVWTFTSRFWRDFDHKKVINNQPCKAEITGKTATIVELIK